MLKSRVCSLQQQEVFVQRLYGSEALWYTFGQGTKVVVKSGATVKPTVSLFPPSPSELSANSATLLCLLSGYSPEGASVEWTVDGSKVTSGVLTSAEEGRDGKFSRSSSLKLSKAEWEAKEEYVCTVTHDNSPASYSVRRSQCTGAAA
ncbi:IGLL5 protein, partial [Atractosteus spatula]|nr:IGLL5 protein [Atractosteus spatula]